MGSRFDAASLRGELFARIPAHVLPLRDVPASHKLVLGAVNFLRDVHGEPGPVRKDLADLTGTTESVVSKALNNWRRRGELRFEDDPRLVSGRRFVPTWIKGHSRPARRASTNASPGAPPERALPYREERETEDVPSPVPPPNPRPAAPVAAKTDGTGRVSPAPDPDPEPDPEMVARLEAEAKSRGPAGLKARLLLAGLREDALAKSQPPVTRTPVQATPVPSAAVQLATPATPIVEGHCPSPPRGRLWPDDDGFPRADLDRQVRALADLPLPDRPARAAAIAGQLAGRLKQPGNALSVETFTRGLLVFPADRFLGLWHTAERKYRHPDRKLSQWIAREAPPLADLLSVYSPTPSPRPEARS